MELFIIITTIVTRAGGVMTMTREHGLDWVRQLNEHTHSVLLPTENVTGQVARLARGGWTPATLAAWLRDAHPTLGAAGLATALQAVPTQPPKREPSDRKPRRCNATVVANTTADIPGSVGYGLAFLVSCPVCATRSISAEIHRHGDRCDDCDATAPAWSGTGEVYCDDRAVAWQLAHKHNHTGARP